ncbi:MAG: hypothetical protein LBQ66_00465 [Planctomycetaceae bacterium]|nr:hypothetical protein [Planctomycetaceae bacterium]
MNKATLGNAVVKDIRSFRLNQLNSFITYLDTGYDVAETQKIIKTMYKNANINWDVRLLDFVLFVYQY